MFFDYAVFPAPAPASCTAASATNYTSATPACTIDTVTTPSGFYIKLAGATPSMDVYTATVRP